MGITLKCLFLQRLKDYKLEVGEMKSDYSHQMMPVLYNFLGYDLCHIPAKKIGLEFSFSKVDHKREALSFHLFLSHMYAGMMLDRFMGNPRIV